MEGIELSWDSGVWKKSHQRVLSEPNEYHMVWKKIFDIFKWILVSKLLLCNSKWSWKNLKNRCENTEVRIISTRALVKWDATLNDESRQLKIKLIRTIISGALEWLHLSYGSGLRSQKLSTEKYVSAIRLHTKQYSR